MKATTACRRIQRRYALPQGGGRLEFEHPGAADGRAQLVIVDISVSGVSFVLETNGPRIDIGATLPAVRVHLGSCELRGELLVMHVTTEANGRAVCGALFYPESDTDLLMLKSAVAGLEAADPR
ncbi:MAG TPA: hypothetical protein VJS92_12540 [Candidatus Polarisedimenticolaceae bacterium]|nr:hypothetical protein [Candidatus Polarisedimenticolaceae bacterium]